MLSIINFINYDLCSLLTQLIMKYIVIIFACYFADMYEFGYVFIWFAINCVR